MSRPRTLAGSLPPYAALVVVLAVLVLAGVVVYRDAAPSRAWSVDLGGAPYRGHAADGLLVVATQDEVLHALELATGRALWTRADVRAFATARVAGERVVVPTLDDTLLGLDARTGEDLWELDQVWPRVFAVGDGVVVVASGVGFAVASLDDGTFLWEYDRRDDTDEREAVEAMTVADGVVYVGYEIRQDYELSWGDRRVVPGGLYAVDLDTGERLWTAPVDDRVPHPPVVDGDLVVVATRSGLVNGLYAIDREDGGVRWEELGVHGVPALVDGVVCFEGADGTTKRVGEVPIFEERASLAGLELASGEEAWRRPVAHEVRGATAAGEVALFVEGARVRGVRGRSGRSAWSLELAGRPTGAPLVADGRLAFVLEDGTVEAYALDGAPRP